MNDFAIIIENLSKTYRGSKESALSNLSLKVKYGEIFGLLGPNGAGKTTTISILCGIYPPSSGKVHIDGKALNRDLKKIKSVIGVVPQDIALYPTLTAWENLLFFGNMYGIEVTVLHQRIKEYLSVFGLLQSVHKRVEQFSGGMKRRTNLIAGILHKPKILFLDEPTAGIDVQSRVVILDFLKELNREGTTIIYTSHHMEEAENLCTSIAIIDKGHVISMGKPKELIAQKEGFTNLESIFLDLTGHMLRD